MHSLANTILDIIFPRFCIGCANFMGNRELAYICKECAESIETPHIQRCGFCEAPTQYGKTCPFCIRDVYLDQLVSATVLDQSIIKNAIHKFKYESVSMLAKDLAPNLDHAFKKNLAKSLNIAETIIIPIPLHWSRQNTRGYNQAELLAKNTEFAQTMLIVTDILKRNFQLDHQAELPSRQDRQKNMQNIFYINKDKKQDILGKTILLIDDVSTSGSTLNDASRALKESGAKKVIALVLARGI